MSCYHQRVDDAKQSLSVELVAPGTEPVPEVFVTGTPPYPGVKHIETHPPFGGVPDPAF